MDTLWSMSTTVREADRTLGFLKVAKLIEGKEWTRENQKVFQILLIQHRQYLNDPSNIQSFKKLNNQQIDILVNPSIDMTYEMAESILEAKNYVGGGDMRGRQSLSPLRKLGLVYIDTNNIVRISDVGNKFINGEINADQFFLDSLLKLQYPNPIDESYPNWNCKPFICILHLIRKVNDLCIKNNMKEKGISFEEFGIFALSLNDYTKLDRYANLIIEYRKQIESFQSDDDKKNFRKEYIKNFLTDIKDPESNSIEYADNIIRYIRQTKLIYIRGKYGYKFIDFEPRRLIEINSILDNDSGKPLIFNSKEEWIKYFATYNSYELPYETVERLNNILNLINDENSKISNSLSLKYDYVKTISQNKEHLKYAIEEARKQRTYLQNLKLKSDYFETEKIDEAISILDSIGSHNYKNLTLRPSLEFEKWANIALNIFNDAKLIKPNTIVGDDNEPVSTASGGVSDIECYYSDFNAICEVTTLTSRDQWYNEGQPVMRHLRDFEKVNENKENYCLFIAPRIHEDTLNTFWIAVKYEYSGSKQKIIPITITQFIKLLNAVKTLHSANRRLKSNKIKEFYDSCLMLDDCNSSKDWLNIIDKSVQSWNI